MIRKTKMIKKKVLKIMVMWKLIVIQLMKGKMIS